MSLGPCPPAIHPINPAAKAEDGAAAQGRAGLAAHSGRLAVLHGLGADHGALKAAGGACRSLGRRGDSALFNCCPAPPSPAAFCREQSAGAARLPAPPLGAGCARAGGRGAVWHDSAHAGLLPGVERDVQVSVWQRVARSASLLRLAAAAATRPRHAAVPPRVYAAVPLMPIAQCCAPSLKPCTGCMRSGGRPKPTRSRDDVHHRRRCRRQQQRDTSAMAASQHPAHMPGDGQLLVHWAAGHKTKPWQASRFPGVLIL